MSFVDSTYFGFLLAVVVLSRLMPTARSQNVLLLAASLLFYGWGHPGLVVLLVGSVVVDWWAARSVHAGHRRALYVSLAVNLGILGIFKYLDFLVDSLAHLLVLWGLPVVVWRPHLPLPPGVSFFTFQSMAYTIDVARGKLRARDSLVDVGAHVAAFPQLVAGPIERAGDLLPQLERRRSLTVRDVEVGVSLLLWGLVQKLVVADTIALWVDSVFADSSASAVVVWAAVLGFMVQIMGDFSGYTDIARGSGRLLGLRLSANFDRPFLATSPSEFWRRWHMTFSRWMHDYVYVPLGGNKKGPARAVIAATLSLVLAGLWHGAAWNFAVWGLWFAAVWVVWRGLSRWVPAAIRRRGRPLGVALTFAVVSVGMLLFREPELARSADVLRTVPWSGSTADLALAASTLGVAVVGGGLLAFGGAVLRREHVLPSWVRGLLWAVTALLLALYGGEGPRDFVYFRF